MDIPEGYVEGISEYPGEDGDLCAEHRADARVKTATACRFYAGRRLSQPDGTTRVDHVCGCKPGELVSRKAEIFAKGCDTAPLAPIRCEEYRD